tara:strand:- start:747 stop:854 length:108 start_codon:yes stop_codon:yes gene_type:complete
MSNPGKAIVFLWDRQDGKIAEMQAFLIHWVPASSI